MTAEPSNAIAHVANVTNYGLTPSSWIFDIGASNHVTSDQNTLHSVSEYGGPNEIILGDGTRLPITHAGHTH